MSRYRVQCYIEIEADYHREAAEAARRELRDPSRWESLFHVVDVNDESEYPEPIDVSKP
jgi:hypothetical protein